MKTQLMRKNKRRYCDADLKSVIIKLKNKIKESINKFKALPKGEKIARILSDVLLILGTIATASDIYFLKQELDELKYKRKILIGMNASIQEYEEEMTPAAKSAASSALGIIIGMIGIVINTMNIIITHKKEDKAMRRDDAKKLIAALIRRRHDDALRIKRLRSRLNDDSEFYPIINKAEREVYNLYHFPGKTLAEHAEDFFDPKGVELLKRASEILQRVSVEHQNLNHGELDLKSKGLIVSAFNKIKEAKDHQIKQVHPGRFGRAFVAMKNVIDYFKK